MLDSSIKYINSWSNLIFMPAKKPSKKTDKQAKEAKQNITPDMMMGEAIQKYPETAEVMFRHGLHCIGCHVSAYETIEQGAATHGIDPKKLVEDMNRAIAKKGKK